MTNKLEGKAVDKAKKMIKILAKNQEVTEAGHYDNPRTIMRYIEKKYGVLIKYSTLAAWLTKERNHMLVAGLKKRNKRA